MRPHPIIRAVAAAALIAIPSLAMAEPDQNHRNNSCNGRWVNGQCVTNTQNGNTQNNGQWNHNRDNTNGRWNNNDDQRRDWERRERERVERERAERERWEREHRGYNNGYNNNGTYNNGYNNGGYYNGGYNNGGYYNGSGGYYGNGGYGNGSGQLNGVVSSFSPYNLYLTNGLHVVLHDGTVINPTGINLTGGQQVRIIGYRNADGTFAANEIDVVNNGGWRR